MTATILLFLSLSTDKPKNSDRPPFPAPKHQPLQAGHHSSRTSVAHVVPSLVPSLLEKHSASAAAVPDGVIHVAASMASHRVKSEETWLPQQQGRGQEREGQLAVSFKPAGNGMDAKRDVHRWECPLFNWLLLCWCTYFRSYFSISSIDVWTVNQGKVDEFAIQYKPLHLTIKCLFYFLFKCAFISVHFYKIHLHGPYDQLDQSLTLQWIIRRDFGLRFL